MDWYNIFTKFSFFSSLCSTVVLRNLLLRLFDGTNKDQVVRISLTGLLHVLIPINYLLQNGETK